MPIVRWENIRKEDGKILAEAVFDEDDERAMEVKGKVDRNFIRMASIGAWPPEEISEDPELMEKGQTLPTVTKWKVREASIVTIGSNHNSLVFYDAETGEKIKTTDTINEVIKLKDTQSSSNQNNSSMKGLNKMLNLSDKATEQEVQEAIEGLIQNRDTLKTEVVTLKDKNKALEDKIKGFEDKAKEQQKAEGVALVDAAVKDGRINADAKEHFIKLFDADFESAKSTLNAIPKRSSVSQQIENQDRQNNTELQGLMAKSWDELDKGGKLVMLKDKYPDVYEDKFEQKFGKKPQAD
jgi:hypothetical protein